MSTSEFRWNKRRKHFSYIFKTVGNLRLNIILTTKPYRMVHGKEKRNIRLTKHPNPNSDKDAYVIPYVYLDDLNVFHDRVYDWNFNINDKRIIKRIKKQFHINKKSQP